MLVGAAVVGVGGGGGSAAPSGRQIEPPGYSGVDTFASLTASTSASVAPEPSAMRIQKSPTTTSYSSAQSSTASASTAGVVAGVSATAAVVVGSTSTVASATDDDAPAAGVLGATGADAVAIGCSVGWSPLAAARTSTVIDDVRTASPSSEVKPITTGTNRVRTTASPPRRANRGSTPARGGSCGAVSQASSQSVCASSWSSSTDVRPSSVSSGDDTEVAGACVRVPPRRPEVVELHHRPTVAPSPTRGVVASPDSMSPAESSVSVGCDAQPALSPQNARVTSLSAFPVAPWSCRRLGWGSGWESVVIVGLPDRRCVNALIGTRHPMRRVQRLGSTHVLSHPSSNRNMSVTQTTHVSFDVGRNIVRCRSNRRRRDAERPARQRRTGRGGEGGI